MPPTYASTMTAPPSPTSVVSCLTSSWPEDPRGRKGPANALAEAWDPQQGWARQRERVMWKPLQTAGPARVDSLISKADRNDMLVRSQRLDDFIADRTRPQGNELTVSPIYAEAEGNFDVERDRTPSPIRPRRAIAPNAPMMPKRLDLPSLGNVQRRRAGRCERIARRGLLPAVEASPSSDSDEETPSTMPHMDGLDPLVPIFAQRP